MVQMAPGNLTASPVKRQFFACFSSASCFSMCISRGAKGLNLAIKLRAHQLRIAIPIAMCKAYGQDFFDF